MRYKNLFLCLLMVPAAMAQESVMPIDITAESLELQQRKGYAVFSGDVKVAHGEMKLGSEKLEVFYGLDGESHIQKIVADGKVTLVYGEDTATGEKAIYMPEKGKVSIVGDVVMVRDGNVLKGGELVYDVNTRQMVLAKKHKQERVKATFSIKGVGLSE